MPEGELEPAKNTPEGGSFDLVGSLRGEEVRKESPTDVDLITTSTNMADHSAETIGEKPSKPESASSRTTNLVWEGITATATFGSKLLDGISALGVWSRGEVTWVEFEDVGCFGPGLADCFERRPPPDSFEVLGKIVG
jgi:hypothetical protein